MRGIVCFLCMLLVGGQVCARTHRKDMRMPAADDVMQRVFASAPDFSAEVGGYEARLYVKGVVRVKRKNFMLRYLPSMFKMNPREREYISETVSNLHFNAPRTYDIKILSQSGTMNRIWRADFQLPEYFHLNVYSTYMIDQHLLSPLSPVGRKYYRFQVDSVGGEEGKRMYFISFIPRYSSSQLVDGSMTVGETSMTVRTMKMKVYSEFFACTVDLTMGAEDTPERLLPCRVAVDGTFRFFGNRLDGHYLALLQYDDIFPVVEQPVRDHLDLSSFYTLRTDTSTLHCDAECFRTLRPEPLTSEEKGIYRAHQLRLDSAHFLPHDSIRGLRWRKVGDVLADSHTFRFGEESSLRMSPLFNPFRLGYSPSRGISYSMKLNFQHRFSGDRLLQVTPRLGYNFKQSDFYWNLLTSYDYLPSRCTGVSMEIGNGNRIYSSAYIDYLKDIPDSLFNFDDLKLRYYNDLYVKFRHKWEIVNGLSLDVKLELHQRTDSKRYDPATDGQLGPDWSTVYIPRIYNSFAPGFRLTWTPRQYYYRDGKRKVNLYSRYPTISLDCEHGLKGVLSHAGSYGRLEIDWQHHIPLGPIRQLFYRLAWGGYSRSKGMYFIDYVNFRRSNLPTGWNDDMGGVFQLLDSRWYNSSRQYASATVTYETPFLLFPYFGRLSRHVFSERLYAGALIVPHLRPYIELGYGMGTRVFDVGVFASFANWKYSEIGAKVTFELFDR